jgi:hypothetical protein
MRNVVQGRAALIEGDSILILGMVNEMGAPFYWELTFKDPLSTRPSEHAPFLGEHHSSLMTQQLAFCYGVSVAVIVSSTASCSTIWRIWRQKLLSLPMHHQHSSHMYNNGYLFCFVFLCTSHEKGAIPYEKNACSLLKQPKTQ